jgi:pilus assembly protein CpaB
MNRRKRTLIVIAIALVCATIASLGVLRAVGVLIKQSEAKQPKQIDVVVAARSVSTGICLGKDDVKVVKWPETGKILGMHPKPEEVIGRGLIASVLENEPLTDAKVAPAAAKCGLPAAIESGKRAISVKVNEVIGVAGFVLPGSNVDVLVTIRQEQQSTSRIVVSNVMVLTAGTNYDQDKTKDGKAQATTVVTLMVTPSEAERIALASAEGQILLTLRNPMDHAATVTAGVRTPDLTSPPRDAKRAGGAPQFYAVEKISKGGRTLEVVR